MEFRDTGSGRLQRPDRLAGISEASSSIGGIGAVALIQLKNSTVFSMTFDEIQEYSIPEILIIKFQNCPCFPGCV